MCYVLFLGAESLPQLHPSPDWEALKGDWPSSAPRLVIEELTQNDIAVRQHFDEEFVVYAGSFEGCGCGFNRCTIDENFEEDDKDLLESRISLESRFALSKYISEYRVTTIYGCWNGDESLPIISAASIALDRLLDRNFAFPERVRLQIIQP